MSLYEVSTERFGVLLLDAANIDAARSRARQMFPRAAVGVSRKQNYRRCDSCLSAPCCCSNESRTPLNWTGAS